MYCFFLPEIWSFFYKGQEPHISKFDRLPPPGNTVEFYDITEDPMEEEPSNVTEIDLTTGSGDEGTESHRQQETFRIKPPGDQQKILAVFRPWPERFLTFDIRIDDSFTPVALQFLSDCVIGWHEEIQEIHIYTDGSFDSLQLCVRCLWLEPFFHWQALLPWVEWGNCDHGQLGQDLHRSDQPLSRRRWSFSYTLGFALDSPIPLLVRILYTFWLDSGWIHCFWWLAVWWWQLAQTKNEGSGTVGWINAARYGALFTCEGPQQPSLQRPGGWICEAKDRARSKHASLYTGLEAALS